MPGTKAGGLKARKTNLEKYGKGYYSSIGKMGGIFQNPNKGFGSNRDLAREAGAKGGRISRRPRNAR